jgi:hypothetical protein
LSLRGREVKAMRALIAWPKHSRYRGAQGARPLQNSPLKLRGWRAAWRNPYIKGNGKADSQIKFDDLNKLSADDFIL